MASDFPSGAAFGLCYMMTITFQTIGALKMGLFQSLIWQGLLCTPLFWRSPVFSVCRVSAFRRSPLMC